MLYGVGELDFRGTLEPKPGGVARTGDGCVDGVGSGLFQDIASVIPARIYLNRRSSFKLVLVCV